MTGDITKIGSIAKIYDGPHATPKKTTSGPYFLSISSLDKGNFDISQSAQLSESEYIKWTRRVTPSEGDLLFAYETRLGEAALMPGGVKACLGRRMGLLRPDRSKVLPQYLLYSYLSPAFQQVIKRNTIRGATVDRIPISEMSDFEIRIPSLKEQRYVVGLLSALDDKIELNRRINDELEQMLRTLYDYWFVQFDFPDASGKPYKSSGGQMIYSDQLKREIPAGWKVGTLSDVSEIYQPKILSAEDLSADGEYPVHGSNGIIGRYHDYNHAQSEVVVSCRGDCGNIHRTPPMTWITGNAMVFKPRDEIKMHNEFLYQALRHVGLKQISTGSVQGQITRTNVENLNIVIPDASTLSEFNLFADAVIEKKLLNENESQKLAELRDWLLPMLMNGQVKTK